MELELGQLLSQARTRRGIELSEAERVTKIRARYLRAMEEDRWELLPGAAYARGFLRTYAGFLELDERPLLEAYERRHAHPEQEAPIPEEMLPRPGVVKRSWLPGLRPIAAALAVIALGALAIAVLGGDDGRERSGPGGGRLETPSEPAPTTTEPTTPAEVTVRLRASAAVWVCLIDDKGRALVDGETLAAGATRGPFRARSFEATFGNGSIELLVDDRPASVPDLAEPLGFRISPDGAERLGESARPDCL